MIGKRVKIISGLFAGVKGKVIGKSLLQGGKLNVLTDDGVTIVVSLSEVRKI